MSVMRKQAGMTLVEIMFAFAIIATVLTLAYAASLNAWRVATTSNQRTQAQYLVQQSLEAIKAYRGSADWEDFIDAMVADGSGFHLVLQDKNGNDIANSFACTSSQAPCNYKVKGGNANLSSVGANTSVPDPTVFTLTISVQENYQANNPVAQMGAPNAGDDVTAVTLLAQMTWQNTQGNNDNLVASTIITEPR